MTVKTSPLSLGSALLLAACFTPSGSSGDPGGTAEAAGPATDVTATADDSTGAAATSSSGTLATTDAVPTTGSIATDPTGTVTSATTVEPCTEDDCACTSNTDCEAPLSCHQGQCVGCVDDTTCDGGVCDPVDHVCRGCREHSECPKTACELDDGVCFPIDATTHAHVDPNATCAEQPCTLEEPCCSIGQALSNYLDSSHLVIHLGAGTVQSATQVVEGGRKVAILGTAETVLTVNAPNDAAMRLGVDGPDTEIDSELYVARVVVSGGGGGGAFRCNRAATLWLDDVQILGFDGRALAATACNVTARRTTLRWNTFGVAVDTNSILALENVMIAHTGAGAALELSGSTEARLLYTTVADSSHHTFGLLACTDASPLLTARNAVLVSDTVGDTVNCSPASYDIADSVVSADQLIGQGGESLVLDPLDVAEQFVDWLGGDLHTLEGSALVDRAVWSSTHPRTDIDGDLRPSVDGTPDVAGADRPAG